MAQQKSEIVFKGSGLDKDNAREYIAKGDGIDRRNIMIPHGEEGVLEQAYGNSAKADGYSHDANIDELKVLGYATDYENNLLYYFVQGDTTDQTPRYLNSIIEYDPIGDTFAKVLFDEGELELEANRLITGASIVDGWIYYNAGTYGLKKINITFGKNFTNYDYWTSGGSYTAGDDVRVRDGRVYNAKTTHSGVTTDPRSDSTNWEVIADTYTYPCDSSGLLEAISLDRMNIPPTTAITFAYGSDTDRNVNNLRGKLFQFAYRYKYRNHGYSRTSPLSLVTLPPDEESIKGEVLNSITTNNKITIAFNAGDIGVVEWTELFVREGNSGTWYYVKRFKDGEETYDFYNDVALDAVGDSTVMTMADAIPRQSDAEIYISENRVLSAGNTEGYDNIDLDVTLAYGFDEVTLGTPSSLRTTYSITEEIFDGVGDYYGKFNIDTLAGGTTTGDYVSIYIESSSPANIVNANFIFTGSTVTDLRDECITAINNASVAVLADTSDPGYSNFDNGDFSVIVALASAATSYSAGCFVRPYAPTTGSPNKWTGFKTGSINKLGLQYFDAQMRPFAVMADENTEVYIPTVPEEKGGAGTAGVYKWKTRIDWTLAHNPPTDAAYWQFVYAGNSNINNFWTYIISSSTGAKDTASDYDTAGTAYTCLNIEPLNNAQTVYPLSNVSYTFTEGDRCRVLTKVSTASDTLGYLVGDTQISDVEIITYDETTQRIVLPYDSTGNKYYAGNSSLIEIYRPKLTTEETIYYAISPIYETYTSSGVLYHRGATQDQTVAQDATGSLTRGDVFFITRAFSEAVVGGGSADTLYLVESPSYSDFYTSDSYDYGKINVGSDKGEVKLTDIRWSNPYLQDTDVNGLCTYDALDYKSIPEKYGDIQAMRQMGDVLKIYTEEKAISMYIGRTEYLDTSGNSTVATSDSVLGSYRIQLSEYGTVHPESVTQNEKYIYGFDAYRGAVWRDGYNGIRSIVGADLETGADFKMSDYFKDKGDAILSSGVSNVDVITGWDDDFKVLYISFRDSSDSSNNETLAFHEPSNRWISFYDFEGTTAGVELFMRYKKLFYAFAAGVLYKQNDTSATRSSFFGVKHNAVVDFVCNDLPGEVKIFNSIKTHSHSVWWGSDVDIPLNATHPNGMSSLLPSNIWQRREGAYSAEFLRNMKTSSASDKAIELRQGEPLRGESVYIRLENSDGVYDDWFLPSQVELSRMYSVLHVYGLGSFTAANYWSSTESTSTRAIAITFDGGTITNPEKSSTLRVRAARVFTTTASYAVRDKGPSGGYIFEITDNGDGTYTCYEAAQQDQSPSKAWSNIDSTLIGTTGSAIGDGQGNTDDIIGQAGHTDSGAKECDDYSMTSGNSSAPYGRLFKVDINYDISNV